MTTTAPPATVNPWRTIWFSPRLTIRQLLDTEPPPNWMPLFAVAVCVSLLAPVNNWLTKPHATAADLTRLCALTVAVGFSGLWPGANLVARYGRFRGGVGFTDQIRVTMAYSSIPSIAGALFWIPLWIATGGAGFVWIDGPQPLLPLALYLGIEVAGYWSLIVWVIMLAEVHRFSLWRALESTLLPGFLFAGGYLILFRIFVFR